MQSASQEWKRCLSSLLPSVFCFCLFFSRHTSPFVRLCQTNHSSNCFLWGVFLCVFFCRFPAVSSLRVFLGMGRSIFFFPAKRMAKLSPLQQSNAYHLSMKKQWTTKTIAILCKSFLDFCHELRPGSKKHLKKNSVSFGLISKCIFGKLPPQWKFGLWVETEKILVGLHHFSLVLSTLFPNTSLSGHKNYWQKWP